MKELISCIVEGLTFSFRKPRFENYQATHLIPPKSVVIGMIANALNKGESIYYPMLREIKLAPLLLSVESRFVDLWTAIQGKGDEQGKRGIFYREHLFRPVFHIYFYSEQFSEEIKNALKQPENIIYLGKSEDLVKIHSMKYHPLKLVETNRFRDIIPIEWMPLIETIEWTRTDFKRFFPPTEESLINSYIPPSFKQAQRDQRSVEQTQEMYVAPGGEFVLKEKQKAVEVDEGNIYLF